VRRLASACIRHRRVTFAAWIAALVACVAAAGAVGESFSTNFELPESDSQRAVTLLEEGLPMASGDSVQIVFAAEDGSLVERGEARRIEAALDEFAEIDGVAGVSSPLEPGGAVSEDGTIALATAQLTERSFEVSDETINEMIAVAEGADGEGLRIELGGESVRNAQQPEPGTAELVGLGSAIVILLITFGSVVAMGLPIFTAVVALGVALSLVTLLTHLVDTADFSPQLAAMIGLGVGIDYALFVVTRFRSGLRSGLEPADAVELAMDTAGRAVLFAGATVCVSLLGLFAIGVDFLYGPALAASLAVLVTMLAALTLLPAVLSKVGRRIDRLRLPGARGTSGEEGRMWSRWSRAIQRRPWTAALVSTAVLIALAIPVLSIEIGNADAGTDPADTTTRQAYDLLAEGFGEGFNGPLLVVGDFGEASGSAGGGSAGLREELRAAPGVAEVSIPRGSQTGEIQVLTVFPDTGPQEAETRRLVDRLRADVLEPFDARSGAETHLGGETAITNDFSNFIAGKLPLFFGIVIVLSALLLLLAFRSILVPLKAVLMNVLSIGASFGVVVAIFQFGWGNELVGISETAPIASFLPVFVFAIVFGLSMDYEVFLMSRVHEEWERRRDASGAVVHGLASTGRVITAAASIMIAVFASFALGGEFVIKLFGVALAAAIAIDAFVIRSLLVPAIMELLGERAWWLPGWLDRRLPRLHIEGPEDGEGASADAEPERAEPGDPEPAEEGQPVG
jgi:RND superfamily putative drug exporter